MSNINCPRQFNFRSLDNLAASNNTNSSLSSATIDKQLENDCKLKQNELKEDKFSNSNCEGLKKGIAISSFLGAMLPVIGLNILTKSKFNALKNSNISKFKSIWGLFEIENFWQILATTVGGIAGGLLGGMQCKTSKQDKEAMYREGIFETLNNITPTTLVGLGTLYSNKTGKLKSVPAKALLIISSVVGGMFIANKSANFINTNLFDNGKPNEAKIRHFKPLDCLVHADDILNLAILTKIPFVNKLQMDKILPFIYARAGYEVGTAKER
ncbi:hypothetical protein IJG72_07180 [bacterium]|nr:hypothetical protein [bacterium]